MNTASVGPATPSIVDAGQEVLDSLLSDGGVYAGSLFAATEEARRALALLVRCQPHEVAFTRNTSHSNALAAQMLWDSGCRTAVAFEHDFPASTLPFLHRGFDVKFVSAREGRYSLESVDEAVRGRDVLIVGHVMYANGFASDPDAVGEIARRRGAHLVLCAYQSVGALRVDFWRSGASFLSGSSNKWLCAGYGGAYLVVRDELLGEVPWPQIGWMSPTHWTLRYNDRFELEPDARVLDLGTPPFVSTVMLGEACRFWFALGPRRVEDRVRSLSRQLRDALGALGPGEEIADAELSGITTVPTDDPAALAYQLSLDRVVCTPVRGGVRIALHAFNDTSDIEEVVGSIRRARDRRKLRVGADRHKSTVGGFMSHKPPAPAGPATVGRHLGAVLPAFAMLAGMELDVFTPLKEGPKRSDELARALDLPGTERLERLLYCLVVAGLLTVEDGRFYNTPEAEAFLVRGGSDYMGGLANLYRELWEAALMTTKSIRADTPLAAKDFAALPDEELVPLLRGLHPSAMQAGRDLHRRFDFSRYRELLDVGGGSGGVAIELARLCPELRSTVVDFPNVLTVAQAMLDHEAPAVSSRVCLQVADVVKAAPSGSYDVAVMRAFIQVLPRDQARQALINVTDALRPGADVYIVGTVIDDSRLSPTWAASYNIIYLNVYEGGQSYTEAEYRTWLAAAGLAEIDRVKLPSGSSIVVGHKPAG